MIPSISTDFLSECEPDEAIRIIGESGFRCVEFGFGHEADFLEGKEDEGARLARIKRAAEEAGVQILQMHGRLFNPCGKNAEENIAWAHRSIERGAKLGVKWVVLHPGSPAGLGADPEELEWTRRYNVDVFKGFAKTAARFGTGVAVENMIGGARGPRFGATVSDLLWLVDAVDSGPIGICWDTGHAELSRVPQGKALRAIGRRLTALHINDNDGIEDRHWTPYRGQANWDEIVAALHEIGYSGPFNGELPGEQKATPTWVKPAKLEYLRRLLGSMAQGEASQEAAS